MNLYKLAILRYIILILIFTNSYSLEIERRHIAPTHKACAAQLTTYLKHSLKMCSSYNDFKNILFMVRRLFNDTSCDPQVIYCVKKEFNDYLEKLFITHKITIDTVLTRDFKNNFNRFDTVSYDICSDINLRTYNNIILIGLKRSIETSCTISFQSLQEIMQDVETFLSHQFGQDIVTFYTNYYISWICMCFYYKICMTVSTTLEYEQLIETFENFLGAYTNISPIVCKATLALKLIKKVFDQKDISLAQSNDDYKNIYSLLQDIQTMLNNRNVHPHDQEYLTLIDTFHAILKPYTFLQEIDSRCTTLNSAVAYIFTQYFVRQFVNIKSAEQSKFIKDIHSTAFFKQLPIQTQKGISCYLNAVYYSDILMNRFQEVLSADLSILEMSSKFSEFEQFVNTLEYKTSDITKIIIQKILSPQLNNIIIKYLNTPLDIYTSDQTYPDLITYFAAWTINAMYRQHILYPNYVYYSAIPQETVHTAFSTPIHKKLPKQMRKLVKNSIVKESFVNTIMKVLWKIFAPLANHHGWKLSGFINGASNILIPLIIYKYIIQKYKSCNTALKYIIMFFKIISARKTVNNIFMYLRIALRNYSSPNQTISMYMNKTYDTSAVIGGCTTILIIVFKNFLLHTTATTTDAQLLI